MMHSWHKDYDKECVPAWDFYPVLEDVKARHELLYPSARLDQLHSEKRYWSSLMPPTQFIHFTRTPGSKAGWHVEGCSDISGVDRAVANAIGRLKKDTVAAGLPVKDFMVKQGLSWGGDDVARVAPDCIAKHLKQKVLPKVASEAQTLTVLLQAKVELVAELRWATLNGELRGRGWRTFQQAPRGKSIKDAGMKGEVESRQAIIAAGLATDTQGVVALEESLRGKVEQVLAEATADADGELPHYLRVDLLVDRQGRAWLGERESWGADLVKATLNTNTGAFTRQDPSKSEVAASIAARAARSLSSQAQKLRQHDAEQRSQSRARAHTSRKLCGKKVEKALTKAITTLRKQQRGVGKRKISEPVRSLTRRRIK